MPQPVVSAYDPTLYHGHPQTAILYAKKSGFTVTEEKDQTSAFREDMPGSIFLLTKMPAEEKWYWVRSN